MLIIDVPVRIPLFERHRDTRGQFMLLQGLCCHSPLTAIGIKPVTDMGDHFMPVASRQSDLLAPAMIRKLIRAPQKCTSPDSRQDPWRVLSKGICTEPLYHSAVSFPEDQDGMTLKYTRPCIDMFGEIRFGKVVALSANPNRIIQYEIIFWLPGETEICRVRHDRNGQVILVYQVRMEMNQVDCRSRRWLKDFWEKLPWVVRRALVQDVVPDIERGQLRRVSLNPGNEASCLLGKGGPWRELLTRMERSVKLVVDTRRREDIRFAKALEEKEHHLLQG